MATRLFKKPDLKSSSIEMSDSIFRDPRELEALKEKIKPEVYLQKLYAKISDLETGYISRAAHLEEEQAHAITSLAQEKESKQKEVRELEEVLILKREEYTELNKPIAGREARAREREKHLDERAEKLDAEAQRIFERDHECDLKLESVKDLADQVGEVRLRMSVKEKQLESRESQLSEREAKYLVRISDWNEHEAQGRNKLQELRTDIELREFNIQSKEENITKREEALLEEKLLVQSQRQALLAAKNGKSSTTNRNIA